MQINWQFILSQVPLYEKAAWLTIKIACIGTILAILVGLICSVILHYKIRILDIIVKSYIELSRNTPLLIQLFFLYYGLPKLGIKLTELQCAIIGLSFLGGSYMAESFRAGFEAVGKVQLESGISLGLSQFQLVRYVILPQAFSVALPSIGANCIFLLKETSVVGVIAIAELMYVTKDLIGMYYQTYEALLLLVGTYLVLILPLSFFFTWLERRVRFAEHGN